jgi:26S proteasome regulatory subunit N2
MLVPSPPAASLVLLSLHILRPHNCAARRSKKSKSQILADVSVISAMTALAAFPQLTSCAGVAALLHEDDDHIKLFALNRLGDISSQFWAEIATYIDKIEELFEDDAFPFRKHAALLASKIHYHLEQYSDSLKFALAADELFDLSVQSEYVDSIVTKCIDDYITLQQSSAEVDPRMESIVNRMFQRCIADGSFEQAIGIAIECRRLDQVSEIVAASSHRTSLLKYCMRVSQTIVSNQAFRSALFRAIIPLFEAQPQPDYLSICICLMALDDARAVSAVLAKLLPAPLDPNDELLAYQIAFELAGDEIQHFLHSVIECLPPASDFNCSSSDMVKRLNKLKYILSGEAATAQYLDFLCRANHADSLILTNVKNIVPQKHAVLHQAVVLADAIMRAGTTVNTFQEDNKDWVKRSFNNWSRFSFVGCIGVIFKGSIKNSRAYLSKFLPAPLGESQSSMHTLYQDAGAYYALGLVHAGLGGAVVQQLVDALARQGEGLSDKFVVKHGICLGLGLASIATQNDEVYEALKGCLFEDNAVAGEAAGISMGLVLLGSGRTEAIEEMLRFAHSTGHEKIVRGVSIGVALMCYGREDQADPVIEMLLKDSDPIFRYGAMFSIAVAYCGTSNNSATRRLLHFAVSDVSDDVRRAATMSLGFVLCSVPEQVPKIVSLLAKSYNPHVRYGVTLAVGISCAGTGLQEAVDILMPLVTDQSTFVRQGALISLALVMMQEHKQSEMRETRSKEVRSLFDKVISSTDKEHDVMSKYGAILATGIIDAGGRNVTCSLRSRHGPKRMCAVVGMTVFLQYWYWYPLTHFLSLTFSPTCAIAINKDFKLPRLLLECSTRESLYCYPDPTRPPEKAALEKVATVKLSTTEKVKARKEKKAMDKSGICSSLVSMSASAVSMMDEPHGEAAVESKSKEEASSHHLRNPCRVLPSQARFVSFSSDSRYKPVVQGSVHGIMVVADLRPSEEAQVLICMLSIFIFFSQVP